MIGIEIEGMAELNKVLISMAKEYPNAVYRGCVDTGLRIEREAKKNETAVDTGNLRSSISTHPNKEEKTVMVTAGGSAGTGAGQLKDVNYAVYQEFGTRYMPGLFFMTHAAEVGFRLLPDYVKKRIDAEVK
jgi:HK97 gp10 family phage protein